MDAKEEVKHRISKTKQYCEHLVSEGAIGLTNPMNTRTDLIETARRLRKLVSAAFDQLRSEIDELPICGPVQIIPESYVPFFPPKPEPEPEATLKTIPTVPHHINHLVDMWIANPTMTTNEVRDLYNDLLDEAFYLVTTRKDGEDSCQC